MLTLTSLSSFAQVINGVKYANTPSMQKGVKFEEAPSQKLLSEEVLVEKCESSREMEDFKQFALDKNLNVIEAYCTYGSTAIHLSKKGSEGTITVRNGDWFGLGKTHTNGTAYYMYMNILYSDIRK